MQTKTELLEAFSEWLLLVEKLRSLDESEWTRPMAEGKWPIRETIGHIVRWDRYFLETAVEPAACGRPVTVKHLDFESFNRESAEWSRGQAQAALLDQTAACRSEIIRLAAGVPEDRYDAEHPDGEGNPFTLRRYLKDFIPHDRHHLGQIEAFLQRTKS